MKIVLSSLFILSLLSLPMLVLAQRVPPGVQPGAIMNHEFQRFNNPDALNPNIKKDRLEPGKQDEPLVIIEKKNTGAKILTQPAVELEEESSPTTCD